ncbi:PTK2 [Cordylochernes scorpioides]|uniref:PTK2 n=1 Tax=Cordylochernes scorpioides TaxID=51811 RepID=A0ABY6K7F3_9ARAC|nr:PTK2 [Cordylochernes scorpioides]
MLPLTLSDVTEAGSDSGGMTNGHVTATSPTPSEPLSGPEEANISPQQQQASPPDRSTDPIYDSTTRVVRAVMALSQGVQQCRVQEYLELVRVMWSVVADWSPGLTHGLCCVQRVGLDLRLLLGSVDSIIPSIPPAFHKEVTTPSLER